jgi:hypothetical protein
MVAQNIPHAGTSHEPVTISVTGGRETDPLGAPDVSNESFQTALVESLRQSALFQSVATNGSASYKLTVRLDSLDRPAMGISMTVNLRSDWTLKRNSDGTVLWQQPVYSSYTAGAGDAFAGITRLRHANEGAARKNIEQGMALLSEAKLPPP